MGIILAVLMQSPYKPELPKLPESNIQVERFMLKGDDSNLSYMGKKDYTPAYF